MPAVETFASFAYPANHSSRFKPCGLFIASYGFKYSFFNVNVNSPLSEKSIKFRFFI